MQQDQGTDLSSSTTLVFIHGWGMNSGVWQPFLRQLRPGLSVQCIDLPGYGTAHDAHIEDYQLPALVDYVAARLPEKAVLVAWSMGGLVAQALAADNHPKVKGLITLASTPKFQADTDWPGIQPNVLQLFTKQLNLAYDQTLQRFLAIQMMGTPNAKSFIREVSESIHAFPPPSHHALNKGLDILREVDLRAQLCRIQVPTLRLYGRLDSLVPHDAISLIQDCHPRSEYKCYEHVSHAPFITHPEWLAQDIIEFWEKI